MSELEETIEEVKVIGGTVYTNDGLRIYGGIPNHMRAIATLLSYGVDPLESADMLKYLADWIEQKADASPEGIIWKGEGETPDYIKRVKNL